MKNKLKHAWLCIAHNRRNFSIALGLIVFPLLVMKVGLAFFYKDFLMGHDEAEHLFVVYALERGEVPYRDFIENHPVLPHLMALKLKQILNIESVYSLYLILKSIIWAHVALCFFVLYRAFSRHTGAVSDGSPKLIVLLSSLGLFSWLVGSNLWQVRPDWLCYTYAILSLCLFVCNLNNTDLWRRVFLIALAGIFGGFATALLPKTPYIFFPFALWVFVLIVFFPSLVFRKEFGGAKRLLWSVAVYVMSGLLSYLILVWAELLISGVSFRNYWLANFVYNAKMHPPLNIILNPVLTPTKILDVGVLGLFGGILLYVIICRFEFKVGQKKHAALLLLAGLVVLVNIVLPVYSNGLTHEHYFIPTFLAFMYVGAALLNRLFDFVMSTRIKLWFSEVLCVQDIVALRLALSIKAILVGYLFFFVVGQYAHMLNSVDNFLYANTIRSKTKDNISSEWFYTDRYYPDGLSHLSFAPHYMPAKGIAWGYYFMLGVDANVWPHLHQLGVSPNPDFYWKQEYLRMPPDVIQIFDDEDFDVWSARVLVANRVSIDWLLPIIRNNYSCMQVKGLKTQVRKGLEWRFVEKGWHPCDFNKKIRSK